MIRVVAGLLFREKEVLVAKRPPHKPYPHYLEFPGGKIEGEETSYAALVRELHEELGIKVTHAALFRQYVHHYADKAVDLHFWHVQNYQGKPYGKEQQLLFWIDTVALAELPILPGNQMILAEIESLL